MFESQGEALFVVAWWFFPNLFVAIVVLMLVREAFTHDRHPEWTNWLPCEQNRADAICPGGDGCFVPADHEWSANKGDYEVFYDGAWHQVRNRGATRSRTGGTGGTPLQVTPDQAQSSIPRGVSHVSPVTEDALSDSSIGPWRRRFRAISDRYRPD
jgi:hypothetical protein